MAVKLAVGRAVPGFSLPATSGESWSLADARGKPVVLYFYPRDNTPGCTREGEDFRDLHAAFARSGTRILGISPDSLASHEKFKAKMRFPFELLSDADQALCRQFNVIREKSMYGRKFMGVERSTFLIGADGTLQREWRKVKVPGHAAEVLETAKALSAGKTARSLSAGKTAKSRGAPRK